MCEFPATLKRSTKSKLMAYRRGEIKQNLPKVNYHNKAQVLPNDMAGTPSLPHTIARLSRGDRSRNLIM
ncbi:hypothetical protein E2C01_038645 [Portunus trituberculatus]|uniref:Uncharacterized protein n=1 Tax=Portunus trituberculatus TaxID=210409 RepID=A0A5B7FIK0_PORTR|nr:hypothetical protein [Portunus trituberculatus]